MPNLGIGTAWSDGSASPQRDSQTRSLPWLRRHGLDRLLVIFGLSLAVPLLYWPSAEALNGYWTDTVDHTYTHGYLVLVISLWLVVRDRKRLAATEVHPVPWAWWLVMVVSLAWLWAWRAAIQDLHLLLLPLLFGAATVAVLGWRAGRVLLFPIGFLYFAMPAWSDLNGILQLLSARATGVMLWSTGIPALMHGDLIELPGGTLKIAEGCSGLHFFIVGLTLATLYGRLSDDSPRCRVLWLAILGGLALLANWLRIYVIAWEAYATDMHTFLVLHHYWFGWAVFMAMFAGFLWLAGRLADRWDRARPAPPPERDPPLSDSRPRLVHAMASLLCLGLLPGLSYGMDLARSPSDGAIAIDWPAAPKGWSGPQPVIWSEWVPVYRRASAQSRRRYVESGGGVVEVFTVAYRTQRQSGKLLGFWNSLLGSDDRLQMVAERIIVLPSGRWRQTTAVDAAGMRSLIWSRYRIGSREFVEPRLSQAWYGIAALTRRPVSSLTALRAVCRPDCSAARARLVSAATLGLRPTVRLTVREPRDSEQ